MNVVKCSLCKKTFNKVFNLKRHIRKFHPDQADTLAPKRTFGCQYCNIVFQTLKELKVHKRSHNNKAAPIRKDNKCPLCDFSNYQKKNLLTHFTERHEITLKYSHHIFPSIDDFKSWEIETENETRARYVKRRKTDVTKAGQTIHYACHRSGNFISESKGLRRPKVQGSHKIGGFCPAEIKLFITPVGLCEVTFLETHVGHQNEIERLSLRQSERETLASKIAQKIPFKEILNEVRDSVDDSQRLHLIKRKDLYNIEKSFKLQGTSVHQENENDTSVFSETEDENPILFHKAQNTVNNVHPELNSEDFVLILMNIGQKEMLSKHGTNCVCLDQIHSQNQNDFQLHMLAVLDNNQEGFPCAFLISNRNDEQVLTIFLFYVKQKVGMAVAPKVFMSDMADCYYTAWLNVMEQPYLRFYCMWHIDREWKSNLFKINGEEKQEYVYNSLRAMLHESDLVAFTSLLGQFFKDIYSDPDTLNFGDYFKDNFEKSAGRWAFCFRLRYGVDTNMKLEPLHKSIKKLYLSGENTVRRLDKAINAILKFVGDRLSTCDWESIITLKESEIGPAIDADPKVEHAYAVSEICGVPEDNNVIADDTLYVDYAPYENATDQDSEYVTEICNNSVILEIDDPSCSLLINQEKEELESSMVKVIREISCIEQLNVFKALIAPIEPAMKAIAEEKAKIQNTDVELPQR